MLPRTAELPDAYGFVPGSILTGLKGFRSKRVLEVRVLGGLGVFRVLEVRVLGF